MTIEQQLKAAQAEAARLREAMAKKKAAAKRGKGWEPSFPGQHRGY